MSSASPQPRRLRVSTKIQHDDNRSVVAPYDNRLSLYRIEPDRRGRNKGPNVRINASRLLNFIRKDEADKLQTITLAGDNTKQGVGLWDMFNCQPRDGQGRNDHWNQVSICMLGCTADYKPIPQQRVVMTSQFLNFSLPSSRIHLNRMVAGDKVAIALHDLISNYIYVLIYCIEAPVMVLHGQSDDPNSALIPCLNARLLHFVTLSNGDDKGANILSYGSEDFDPETGTPFLEWMMDSVYDSANAFPWKPHFLPFTREEDNDLPDRLREMYAEATPCGGYDAFDVMCRSAYRANKDRRDAIPRDQRGRDTDNTYRPHVEVVTIGSDEKSSVVVARISNTDCPMTVRFDSATIPDKVKIVETFLCNKGLDQFPVGQEPHAIRMADDIFSAPAIYRIFTANF